MTQLFEDERQMLASLQAAVREALDRKRRLGQYAVVWENGHPVFIGDNPPPGPVSFELVSERHASGIAEPGEGF